MAKRDFLIVVRNRYGENCYFKNIVAHSKNEAIENFAKFRLGIRGNALKNFLNDNSNEEMIYAMVYWDNRKKMAEIERVKEEARSLGNELPECLDEYRRQPERLPSNVPAMESTSERPRQNFPTKSIPPVPIKNVGGKTERGLSDFAEDLLHHLKLEHVADREDGDYNN